MASHYDNIARHCHKWVLGGDLGVSDEHWRAVVALPTAVMRRRVALPLGVIGHPLPNVIIDGLPVLRLFLERHRRGDDFAWSKVVSPVIHAWPLICLVERDRWLVIINRHKPPGK